MNSLLEPTVSSQGMSEWMEGAGMSNLRSLPGGDGQEASSCRHCRAEPSQKQVRAFLLEGWRRLRAWCLESGSVDDSEPKGHVFSSVYPLKSCATSENGSLFLSPFPLLWNENNDKSFPLPHGRLRVKSHGRCEAVYLNTGNHTSPLSAPFRRQLCFLFPLPRSWEHTSQAAWTARPQGAHSQALEVSFQRGLTEMDSNDLRYVGWSFHSSLEEIQALLLPCKCASRA